jgi:hypothetical protein
MKWCSAIFCLAIFLLQPGTSRAQLFGRVECPRQDGYVYLYSSVATMDVRSTLKCGQKVTILDRFGNFFYVQTDGGDTGYVPFELLTLVKGTSAEKTPPSAEEKKTPVMAYDPPKPKSDPASADRAAAQGLSLEDGTLIRLKLIRAVSSGSAHVGDPVDFEVLEDVIVGGYVVVTKGTIAHGVVSEAVKSRLGRNPKLNFSLTSIRLSDEDKAGLRTIQESKTEGRAVPLMGGKDVSLTQGMEVTAFVNGSKRLNPADFAKFKKDGDAGTTTSAPQK